MRAQAASGKQKGGKAAAKAVEAMVGINMDSDPSSLVGGSCVVHLWMCIVENQSTPLFLFTLV